MKTRSPSSSNLTTRAAETLHPRLAKLPFRLEHEVTLNQVIEKEANESLTKELADYHRHPRAHFDLLIRERKARGSPILAIELDGPEHKNNPEVRRRDHKKNRLCRGVLPLLRVPYQDIRPQFKSDDFLSYIVEVVLEYKLRYQNKNYASPQHPNKFTERESDEVSRH